MIREFKCKESKLIWEGYVSKKLPREIQDRALRKLRMLDSATCIEDLKNPPSNNLEKLKGDMQNQMSIRINNQWRLCFTWENNDAYAVFICDYH